jgi:hypothetical protein
VMQLPFGNSSGINPIQRVPISLGAMEEGEHPDDMTNQAN